MREDVASAQASGAEGTPTFYANGHRQIGRYDADTLARALTGGRPPPAPPAPEPDTPRSAAALPAIGRLRASGETAPDQALELAGLEETPDGAGAFPRLTAQQIALLTPFGERRHVEAGEPLFGAGEPGADFVVVVSGAVAMVDGYGGRNRVRNVHGQGRFLGELGILSGQATLLTPVAQRAGEVLVIPAARLQAALDGDADLRDLVLRAYLLRRSLLIGTAARVRIIGSGSAPETQRLRAFADRQGVAYTWTDLDTDDGAAALLAHLGIDPEETPVAITREAEVLRAPTDAELGRALGIDDT